MSARAFDESLVAPGMVMVTTVLGEPLPDVLAESNVPLGERVALLSRDEHDEQPTEATSR